MAVIFKVNLLFCIVFVFISKCNVKGYGNNSNKEDKDGNSNYQQNNKEIERQSNNNNNNNNNKEIERQNNNNIEKSHNIVQENNVQERTTNQLEKGNNNQDIINSNRNQEISANAEASTATEGNSNQPGNKNNNPVNVNSNQRRSYVPSVYHDPVTATRLRNRHLINKMLNARRAVIRNNYMYRLRKYYYNKARFLNYLRRKYVYRLFRKTMRKQKKHAPKQTSPDTGND